MDSTKDNSIHDVFAKDMVGKGKCKVTYAKVKEDGKYGKEVRMLVKCAYDGLTYGLTTSAKQIVNTCEERIAIDKLIGQIVVFKCYPFTGSDGQKHDSIKMFVND